MQMFTTKTFLVMQIKGATVYKSQLEVNYLQ